MAVYNTIILLTSNYDAMGLRISALSNSIKNLAYISIVLCLFLYGRIGANCKWLLAITCLGFKTAALPSLTNTLFSIHPPLLYCAIAFSSVVILRRNSGWSYIAIFGFFISMALGGLWSTQELNWGGWWNWDVLECGIAYIWVLSTLYVHNKKKKLLSARNAYVFCVSIVWAIYTALNKYGLATSIHSFVASKATRTHYHTIIFTYGTIVILASYKALWPAATLSLFLVTAYLSLQWCAFFKGPLTLFALTLMLSLAQKTPIARVYHALTCGIAAQILIFNWLNSPMFYGWYTGITNSAALCQGPFWSFMMQSNGISSVIWNSLFLSKPRYSMGTYFAADSTRSLFGRHTALCFLK